MSQQQVLLLQAPPLPVLPEQHSRQLVWPAAAEQQLVQPQQVQQEVLLELSAQEAPQGHLQPVVLAAQHWLQQVAAAAGVLVPVGPVQQLLAGPVVQLLQPAVVQLLLEAVLQLQVLQRGLAHQQQE